MNWMFIDRLETHTTVRRHRIRWQLYHICAFYHSDCSWASGEFFIHTLKFSPSAFVLLGFFWSERFLHYSWSLMGPASQSTARHRIWICVTISLGWKKKIEHLWPWWWACSANSIRCKTRRLLLTVVAAVLVVFVRCLFLDLAAKKNEEVKSETFHKD